MLGQKGKSNTRKNDYTTRGNKPEVLAKEGRLKRYRETVKQNRKNRTFQNNERKFYPQVGGDSNKAYQQLDAKKKKLNNFGVKHGNQ